jgi:hypothetical protein
MIEQNPGLGTVLLAILFGPIFYVYHGLWGAVVLDALLIVFTVGLAHILMSFLAPKLVRQQLLKDGYVPQFPAVREELYG